MRVYAEKSVCLVIRNLFYRKMERKSAQNI